MRTTYLTALVIALILIGWMYSGDHARGPEPTSIAEQNRNETSIASDSIPTRVRVKSLDASEQARLVKVRGRTQNKRTVDVKAELAGSVIARPVERGTRVEKGDLLCQISTEDRAASVTEAQAALIQARIDYEGALSLRQRGFNSESAIAAAKARLAAADANLKRKNLDLTKLHVKAPFAGVIENVHLEVGDYTTPGAPCATVVDLDPMLLTGQVTERDVTDLRLGQPATGVLRDGTKLHGEISFIGHQGDSETRTYAIEVQLPNPDYAIRSGITTEIAVPVENVLAQRISPAVFALDDSGAIGVRTIDEDNIVEFYLVEVLSDSDQGVWVTGLPPKAHVIVVGQELVVPGERVDPVFENVAPPPAELAPAVNPDTTEPPAEQTPTLAPEKFLDPPNSPAVALSGSN